MKSSHILILRILLFAPLMWRNVAASEKAQDTTEDEQSIKNVLATYVESWN